MTFIIKSKHGNILTTTGRFEPPFCVGAGGYSPKEYKTHKGAERHANDWNQFYTHCVVVELDEKGAEKCQNGL